MVAVIVAEYLLHEVGGAIDYKMLFNELGSGIDASQQFDHSQSVEGAVGVPDGVENLRHAVSRRLIALLRGDPRAQLSFQVTDMSRGDQQLSRPCAEIQISA